MYDINLPPELLDAATELARTERARYLSISLVYRQPNDGNEAALYCLLDEWPTSEAAQIAAAHREIERLRAELEQAQACVAPASRNGHQPGKLICKKCGQHFQRVQQLGITRERVRQIEAVALRRLRHPHLGAGLRAYLGEGVAA
jgi:hypothetical protein